MDDEVIDVPGTLRADESDDARASVDDPGGVLSGDAQAQNYSDAKARLDEIVKQVRAKDVSLERSLDLLEEGVKLANQCTELIDQTRWDEASGDLDGAQDSGEELENPAAEDTAGEAAAGAAEDDR